MLTPTKPEKQKTFSLRFPYENWENLAEEDKAPSTFTTTGWTYMPGINQLVAPDTIVFMQAVKDRDYDY